MKKTLLGLLAAAMAIFLVLSYTPAPQVLAGTPLRDMGSSWDWAKPAASYLVDEGIIVGYEDGTFRPGNTLSRAELVTMLVRSLNLRPEAGEPPFADTQAHWVGPFLQAAVIADIVDPTYYGTHFRPDEHIERAEIARLIVRAMGASIEDADSTPPFEDVRSLTPSDRAYVAVAASEGIIIGDPGGTFRPYDPANRAEAAIMIHRMLLGEISRSAVDFERLLEGTETHPVAGYWPVELESNHFILIADDVGAVFPHVIVGLDAARVTILDATSDVEQELGRFAYVDPDDLAPDVQDRFPMGMYTVSFAFEERSTSHIRIPEELEGPGAAVQRIARVHSESIEELPSHWSLAVAGGARIFWSKTETVEPQIIMAFSATDMVFVVSEDAGPGEVRLLEPQEFFDLPPEFSAGVYVLFDDIME